jgi:hypothetical protein
VLAVLAVAAGVDPDPVLERDEFAGVDAAELAVRSVWHDKVREGSDRRSKYKPKKPPKRLSRK